MTIIELVLDEDAEVYGIDAISLVERPAIERNWVALKEQASKQEFSLADADKRLIVGPALVPDQPIYRRSEDGEEYYVYFSKSTIRRASELYLIHGNQKNATLEHEQNVKGLSLVESWIVEGSEDKSKLYGMDVPNGTWMVTMRVDNDAIWEKFVKTGEVKGFSIEGYFVDRMAQQSSVDSMMRDIREELESYSDYPQSVKNNAKKVLKYTEENGWGSCGTGVGKQRANQLAKGEAISVSTIKRMRSYLQRHDKDLDASSGFGDGCGYLMYMAWGGKAALRWAESKLRELDLLEEMTEVVKSAPVNPLVK